MTKRYSGPMIKLIATNYSVWKSMMEDLLNYKDLYDLIKEIMPSQVTCQMLIGRS